MEQLVHLDGNVIKISVPGLRLGRNNAERARTVAQILTVTRGFGFEEPGTPLEVIRTECERLKVYDQANFSSQIKALAGYVITGTGPNRRLRGLGRRDPGIRAPCCDAGRGRVMADLEIEAMASVANALADLEQAAQQRVLDSAAARYGVTLTRTGRDNREEGDNGDDERDNGGSGDDASYEHFAELFDAASPTSTEDKALVAAYWVQIHGGEETWGAQQLNKELKNLGHGLTHIAEALSSNMNKQPKRVIQLKKAGSSQQARKTYKVTTEGIKYVQKMLVSEGVS